MRNARVVKHNYTINSLQYYHIVYFISIENKEMFIPVLISV